MITIGERINGSIKSARKAIEEKDANYLKVLAKKQLGAGADYLDINVGTGHNEVENMKWLIEEIGDITDVRLVIDTADEQVLDIALKSIKSDYDPIINSITAEEKRLKIVLPYVAEYNAMVIALAMGGDGKTIPRKIEGRLKNCAVIAKECQKAGIPMEKILFDPLIEPQSTDQSQSGTTLKTIEKIKEEFPAAKICIGLSNVSFGLPLRKLVNSTFLIMAISRGIDAAILDPLDPKLMTAIKAAEMLIGRDKFCKQYIKVFRNNQLIY
ncbi:MAG: dihydropteroate synthase [Thermodesulfobacteriota bacterium]|nr:dihydropteroate synthase [Thermodesulfobacteriota bacterium]